MLSTTRTPRPQLGIPALLTCVSFVLPSVAASESRKYDEGDVPDPVIFAGSASYPPFQWLDQDGRAHGFLIDLQEAIASAGGRAAEHRLMGWEDALRSVESEEADVIALFASDQRRERFDFTEPIYYVGHGIFSSAANPVVADPDDLTGQRIAVTEGGYAQNRLRNQPNEVDLVPRRDIRSALQATLDGDADIAVVAAHTARRVIAEDNLEARQTSPPFWPQPYVLAVNPDRTALLEWLQIQVALIQVNGTYYKVYNDWLPELEWQQPTIGDTVRRVAWLIAVLLFLASVGYFWSWSLRRKVAQQTAHLEAELDHKMRLQEELEYRAEHDPLTELPNRAAFVGHLIRRIESQPYWNPTIIVFRFVNREQLITTFSYGVIKELMNGFARRLEALDFELISHFGSGLFAALSSERTSGGEILGLMNEPLEIQSFDINPRLVLGVVSEARTGGDTDMADELIRRAITALSTAERTGETMRFYDAALEPDPADVQLLQDFHRDGTRDMFLEYHPKVDLKTGRIEGAEALVRWQHSSLGVIPPARFIPLLEKSGLIRQVTHWVIEESARMGIRSRMNDLNCSVSVNLTPKDLLDTGLLAFITSAMGAMEPRCLRLEITETGFFEDPERARGVLAELRNAGIRCAVDDFGTGYSSLSYLSEFPVDEVKLDRSFVSDMLDNERHQVIVRSTISLAHELGLTVTAEGVEDARTMDALADMGCDAVQGFVISRSLPEKELLPRLGAKWSSVRQNDNV